MRITQFAARLLILLSIILIIYSCKKSSLDRQGQSVLIDVRMASDEFDGKNQNYRSLGYAQHNQFSISEPVRLASENLILDKDYQLIAEVVTENPASDLSILNRMESYGPKSMREPIMRVIKFRLVVYSDTGEYLEDKIYTINSSGIVIPENGKQLELDRGRYYFVAYSYNLNVAPVDNLSGTDINYSLPLKTALYPQFMLFRSGLVDIGPNHNNNLNIAFKYKSSPMKVTIDATAANGYLVANVGGTRISSNKSDALISFNSGEVLYHGDSTSKVMPFPVTNQDIVISSTVWMSNDIADGSLQIGSLRVGPLSRTVPIVLENIKIRPGVGYNIRLRVVPGDRYEVIQGQQAVLINGRYWMRRNIGVSESVDPDLADENGSFQALFGDYFQWGKPEIRANGFSGAVAPESDQWSIPALNGSWYSETDNGGKVLANDPCPRGWRIPTSREFYDLIQETTQLNSDNKGTDWRASVTNYYTAKVFRSKRDRNVFLTFPTAGAYQPGDRAIIERGGIGFYWTSTEEGGSENSVRMKFTTYDGADIGAGRSNRTYAFPVRCTQAVY